MGAVTNTIRQLFIWLDYAVYWLIDQMYSLFSLLTEASIFTQDQIESFSNRIYVLVSIIMFFRLGFAFITYIVNPESFSDKQKGGGALIKKVVITMALLVSVPTIFNEAFYVQQLVFKNNIIDKVLLGDTVTQNEDANQHRSLSTYAFMSFFKPSQSLSACQNYEGIAISEECIKELNAADETGGNPGTAYKEALANYDLDLILKAEVVNSEGLSASIGSNDFFRTDRYYLFDYNYPISTIVGALIAWILLGFCLDLAVRTVKLGFLQIIAPIPIILSLAPAQKNNTLGNWGKECISTWASLFVRVMVISFALSAIITINTGGGIFSFVTGGTNTFSIVTVFVMIGILLFAKEFPKLLEEILGIKGAGNMTFNAWKKLGSVPLAGGAMTAGATMLGAGALAAGRGLWGTAKSLGAGVGSALKGKGFGTGFNNEMSDTGKRMATRMGAGWSSSKEKFTSAGLMGTDKLGGSMKKSYAENYSKDYKKTVDEIEKGNKYLEKSKEHENNGGSKYDIYKSRDFANSVRDMDNAKTRRDTMSNEAEKIRMRYDAGESVSYIDEKGNELTGADAVITASVDAKKASGDYDKAKAAFDKEKIIHKTDAAIYTAYTAAEDRAKVKSNITKYTKAQEVDDKSIQNKFGSPSDTGRNSQLQDAIVSAINQGFANMNNQNNNTTTANPTNNVSPGLNASDHANDTSQQVDKNIAEQNALKQKTGFDKNPTDR